MDQDLYNYMKENNLSQEQVMVLVSENKAQLVFDLEGMPYAIIVRN